MNKRIWLFKITSGYLLIRVSIVVVFTLSMVTFPDYCSAQTKKSTQSNNDTLTQIPAELKSLYNNLMLEKASRKTKADEPEIDGLIFDETRSKAGHEFYETFFSNWEPPLGASNFSIFITEMPFAMNLSIISVKLNDYEVINTRLQPRADFITALAGDAVNMTKEALLNLEDLKRQVEQGDQIGTGIY